MRIRSNTPLSDNEMRKVKEIFLHEENPDAALWNAFPSVQHRIEGDTVYLGSPPWDISQELQIESEL